jgi:hypothetical protein
LPGPPGGNEIPSNGHSATERPLPHGDFEAGFDAPCTRFRSMSTCDASRRHAEGKVWRSSIEMEYKQLLNELQGYPKRNGELTMLDVGLSNLFLTINSISSTARSEFQNQVHTELLRLAAVRPRGASVSSVSVPGVETELYIKVRPGDIGLGRLCSSSSCPLKQL